MAPWFSNSRKTGLLLLLASAFPTAVWAVLLFVGTPDCVSKWEDAKDFMQFVFSIENSDRLPFVILAGIPLGLIILAVSYLRRAHIQTRTAAFLFAANLAFAALSFFEGPEDLAFFIALPAWWGWKCVTESSNFAQQQ